MSLSDNRLLQLILEAQGGAAGRMVAVTPAGGAAGVGDATKVFSAECLELTVSNDSDAPLTFTAGGFGLTLGPREVFDREPVGAFTQVSIDADPAGAWRVYGYRAT